MLGSRRTALVLATSVLAGSAVSAVTALANQGNGHIAKRQHGRAVLDTSLAPSVPTDPVLLGSPAGGVPWVLRSGEATLRRNGRLDVKIRGLVIPVAPFTGTTGPVMTVDASLYCGGDPTPVGTTKSVPISSHGNARIRDSFTLPSKCLIPALLIHPNGGAMGAPYIAASGFGG